MWRESHSRVGFILFHSSQWGTIQVQEEFTEVWYTELFKQYTTQSIHSGAKDIMQVFYP